jgi:hypothetical protein
MESEALHQLIVSIDVQDSGQRDNPGQLTLRKVVYDVIETALDAAAIPDDVLRSAEDRGDGALLRIDALVPKARVVGRWVEELNQALRARNRELRDPVRLRTGIHAGEVHGDPGASLASMSTSPAGWLAARSPRRRSPRHPRRSWYSLSLT